MASLSAAGSTPALAFKSSHLLQADSYARWLHTRDITSSKIFWLNMLSGFEQPISLSKVASEQLTKGIYELREARHTVTSHCDEEISGRLRSVAKNCDVTLNNLLQGAFALALCVYQDTDDIVFGAVRACRRTVLMPTISCRC